MGKRRKVFPQPTIKIRVPKNWRGRKLSRMVPPKTIRTLHSERLMRDILEA